MTDAQLAAVVEKALQEFVVNRVKLGTAFFEKWYASLQQHTNPEDRESLSKALECFEEANLAEADWRLKAGMGPCVPSSGYSNSCIQMIREAYSIGKGG